MVMLKLPFLFSTSTYDCGFTSSYYVDALFNDGNAKALNNAAVADFVNYHGSMETEHMRSTMTLKITWVFLLALAGLTQLHAESERGAFARDLQRGGSDRVSVNYNPPRDKFNSRNNVVGAVFVATNAAPNNEVLMYHQARNGQLTLAGKFPTGGIGSGPGQTFRGDPLGSQNSMIVSDDKRFLLVSNFLSNSISVFRIRRNGLILTDVEPLDDAFPVSLTEHEGVVYALSLGSGGGRIQGFRLNGRRGRLNPLANSTRFLDAGAPDPSSDPSFIVFSPSDLLFSPDGRRLVIIVKGGPSFAPFNAGDGRILVFAIGSDGRPTTEVATETPTLGDLPFAGVFDNNGHLVVVESFGGPPLASEDGTAGISSYDFNPDGSLQVLTESLPLGVLDTCWIVRVDNTLFTANFFSDSIASVRVRRNGILRLLDSNAAVTPKESFNLDLLALGGFLYNVLPGEGAVAGFRIGKNGRLRSIGQFSDGLEPTPNEEPAIMGSTEGGSPAGLAGVLF